VGAIRAARVLGDAELQAGTSMLFWVPEQRVSFDQSLK
jgi:hypothetical protein